MISHQLSTKVTIASPKNFDQSTMEIATNNSFPFLELPRELRDLIYRFIFKADTPLEPITHTEAEHLRSSRNHHLPPGITDRVLDNRILCLNKQIFTECYDILYKENTFAIRSLSRSFPLQRLDVYNRIPNLIIVLGQNPSKHFLQLLVGFLVRHSGLQMLEINMAVSFYIWAKRGLASVEGDSLSRYEEILEPLRMIRVGKKVRINVELLDGAPFQYQIYAASARLAGEARLLEFVGELERNMRG